MNTRIRRAIGLSSAAFVIATAAALSMPTQASAAVYTCTKSGVTARLAYDGTEKVTPVHGDKKCAWKIGSACFDCNEFEALPIEWGLRDRALREMAAGDGVSHDTTLWSMFPGVATFGSTITDNMFIPEDVTASSVNCLESDYPDRVSEINTFYDLELTSGVYLACRTFVVSDDGFQRGMTLDFGDVEVTLSSSLLVLAVTDGVDAELFFVNY